MELLWCLSANKGKSWEETYLAGSDTRRLWVVMGDVLRLPRATGSRCDAAAEASTTRGSGCDCDADVCCCSAIASPDAVVFPPPPAPPLTVPLLAGAPPAPSRRCSTVAMPHDSANCSTEPSACDTRDASAPAATSICMARASRMVTATCSGDAPVPSWRFGSAPAANRIPKHAASRARCSAVCPWMFCAFGSAPSSSICSAGWYSRRAQHSSIL